MASSKVNALALAGIGRNIRKSARSIVNAQYTPQLREMENARQQDILQGKAQEDRARTYGTQLADQYAQTLQGVGQVSVPDNPLAAGGQSTQTSQIDNWKGYLAALSASGGQRGSEQAAQIATTTDKNLQDLALKRGDLVAQREGDVAKETNDLGQQAFTNYATLEGLGLKKDSMAQQLAIANLGQQYKYDALGQALTLADQRNATTQRGQNLSHSDRQASLDLRKNLRNGKGFLDPTKEAKFLDELNSTLPYAKSNSKGRTVQQLASSLIAGTPSTTQSTIDPKTGGTVSHTTSGYHAKSALAARAAAEIAVLGGLTQDTIQQYHHLGVHVKRFGRAPSVANVKTYKRP